METKDKYKFTLLNLIILYVTMPGSVYIAYFDSYYKPPLMNVIVGFYNWFYSYLAFSLIVLAYLTIKRKKRLLGAYLTFIVFLMILYVMLFLYIFPGAAKPSLSTFILGMFQVVKGAIIMFPLFLPGILNPLVYLQFHPIFSLINLILLVLIILFSYKIFK
mgnify:CR=1 FL=1